MLGGCVGASLKQLDMLMVIDLDEGDANIFAVFLSQRVLFVETKKIVPERDGLRQIGDEVPNVRNAGNLRSRRTSLLCKEW